MSISFLSGFYKASNSVTYLVITVNTFCFCDEDFSFLLLFLVFCKRCMFILVCSVYFNWVCWVRVNFSGEPGHVYIWCVCLRCFECLAGTILFGHFGGVGGGTVRIFLSLRLCSGGYGTVEMVKGVVRVFPCFLQFAVSSFGGWISAVGIFVLYFCW